MIRFRPYVALRVLALCLLVPALLTTAPMLPAAQEREGEPARVGLEEEVEVRIIQVELTAWPGNDNPEVCLDLNAADFELRVNGMPREILAVDRLHEYGRLLPQGSPRGADTAAAAGEGDLEASASLSLDSPSPGRDPMQFVFYFDILHLNKHIFECKGMTQPLVFSWVRKMLEEEFQPGDRVMLVSFKGWPNIHTGWVEDREEALVLLEELENTPGIMFTPEPQRLDRWMEGWMVLFQALGLSPGRKHLFHFGDDMDWNPTATDLNRLVGRAQANKVLVHAVNLLWHCRGYSIPNALGTLPFHTGGRLFGGGQTVSRAVSTLRRLQACRFRLSFRSEPGDSRRRRPSIRVTLNREDVRLAAPASFQVRSPSMDERTQALALLPRWEQGLRVDVALWPLHPTGRKKRWDALLMAWIRRTGASPTSEALPPITVEARVSNGAKTYASYHLPLAADAMDFISHDPTGYLQLFRVEVKSGDVDMVVVVHDALNRLGASIRTTVSIPAPPRPGTAHPWLLLDGLMTLQGQSTVRPSFTTSFSPSRPPWFLGYACPPLEENGRLPPGWLVGRDGQEGRTVNLSWLGEGWGLDPDDSPCGWLLGKLEGPLPKGLWTFEPPAALLDEKHGTASLHFRIREAEQEEGLGVKMEP
ncbi:MAG: hypothetical protein E2P03_08060 [Acidobacteria bacterium]|nr:MAG: hypothetical protein E2P03_08060 [Acidobacteriota bacterium]